MLPPAWTPLVKYTLLHPNAQLPRPELGYAVNAGAYLVSCQQIRIWPGEADYVSTGLAIGLPEGFEGQVRSSLDLAHKGIVVADCPGTIDPGFRSEIKVLLANRTNETFAIQPGDRIAILVIARYAAPLWEETDDLIVTQQNNKTLRAAVGLMQPAVPLPEPMIVLPFS